LTSQAFKGAFEVFVAGPAPGMKFSRHVQVIGVVAFMDADCLQPPVSSKQRLKAGVPLLRLGDAAVAIILAERIVSHEYIYKPGGFFCQIQKTAVYVVHRHG
jgi:hypothetical protein